MKANLYLIVIGLLCAAFLFSATAGAVDPIDARIDSLSRPSGHPGQTIRLRGSFSPQKVPNQGTKNIYLFTDSQSVGSLIVQSWSQSRIAAKIPYGIKKGRYDMKVCGGSLNNCSNSVDFIVRGASAPDLRFTAQDLVVGFKKQKVACGKRVTLTPREVRWLPDGRVDFDIQYAYEEYNDVFAKGFKNTISFNKHNYAGKTPVQLAVQANQQIPGKGQKTITTHATIAEPEWGMLIIELNKDQLQKEIEGFSNRCAVALYFKGFKQDLAVTDIKLKTKNPKRNQKLTFDITVKNIGKEVTAKSIAGIRIGGGGDMTEFSVPQLGPGKQYTRRVTLPGLSKAQKYRITVIADYKNRIREINDGNNERYKTFTVKK